MRKRIPKPGKYREAYTKAKEAMDEDGMMDEGGLLDGEADIEDEQAVPDEEAFMNNNNDNHMTSEEKVEAIIDGIEQEANKSSTIIQLETFDGVEKLELEDEYERHRPREPLICILQSLNSVRPLISFTRGSFKIEDKLSTDRNYENTLTSRSFSE